jgi:hypothetical protein
LASAFSRVQHVSALTGALMIQRCDRCRLLAPRWPDTVSLKVQQRQPFAKHIEVHEKTSRNNQNRNQPPHLR